MHKCMHTYIQTYTTFKSVGNTIAYRRGGRSLAMVVIRYCGIIIIRAECSKLRIITSNVTEC